MFLLTLNCCEPAIYGSEICREGSAPNNLKLKKGYRNDPFFNYFNRFK